MPPICGECGMRCHICNRCHTEWCEYCDGDCPVCCEEDAGFDADELGLDPEEDDA